MSAPSNATIAPGGTTAGVLPLKAKEGRSPQVTPSGVRTMTPAAFTQWEAGLTERTELCLDVAGRPGATLTVYAGPDDRESLPVAIITGLDGATYVSRQGQGSNIGTWITSILLEIAGEPEALPFDPPRLARQTAN